MKRFPDQLSRKDIFDKWLIAMNISANSVNPSIHQICNHHFPEFDFIDNNWHWDASESSESFI